MKTDLSINVQVNIGLTEQMATIVKAILEQLEPKGFGRYQTIVRPVQANEQPAGQEQEEAPKALTEEDVRKAMHEARQRIEGEDYKEHTNSEAYNKYHKQLTAQFKNIAAELGAEKPSLLPEDQRASFIHSCKELTILEDGTIGVICPF